MDLCVNQMKAILNSQQLPENASMEIIGRACHATEAFVQVFVIFCNFYSQELACNDGLLFLPEEMPQTNRVLMF